MLLLALLLAAAPAQPPPLPATPLPLQAEAERALPAPAAGALMDVATGRLLALVRPEELATHAHAPGSLMKLVAAWAALRADQGTRSFECTGKDVHRGKVRSCWRRDGHGRIGLRQALSDSCDVWFYKAARLLGPKRLLQAAREMGLGSATGSDVPGEAAGALPEPLPELSSPEFAVGRMEGLALTGLQALSLMGALANGGTLWSPRLAGPPVQRGKVGTRDELEDLSRALRDAVQSGTGAAASDLPIAGKTGTAPVPGQEEPLAWFAGFAPDDAPQVAVVAFVPEGLGARDAAAAASDLTRVYFQWRDRTPAAP
jgi:penicillin-binding protein 2